MIKYNAPKSFKYTSRYQNCRVIYNTDVDANYFEVLNNYVIDTKSYTPQYHLVEKSERNRLDIIANKYYNDPSLYWVIAKANHMIDPFVVIPNTILTIPSKECLYAKGGPLAFKQ